MFCSLWLAYAHDDHYAEEPLRLGPRTRVFCDLGSALNHIERVLRRSFKAHTHLMVSTPSNLMGKQGPFTDRSIETGKFRHVGGDNWTNRQLRHALAILCHADAHAIKWASGRSQQKAQAFRPLTCCGPRTAVPVPARWGHTLQMRIQYLTNAHEGLHSDRTVHHVHAAFAGLIEVPVRKAARRWWLSEEGTASASGFMAETLRIPQNKNNMDDHL